MTLRPVRRFLLRKPSVLTRRGLNGFTLHGLRRFTLHGLRGFTLHGWRGFTLHGSWSFTRLTPQFGRIGWATANYWAASYVRSPTNVSCFIVMHADSPVVSSNWGAFIEHKMRTVVVASSPLTRVGRIINRTSVRHWPLSVGWTVCVAPGEQVRDQ